MHDENDNAESPNSVGDLKRRINDLENALRASQQDTETYRRKTKVLLKQRPQWPQLKKPKKSWKDLRKKD